jgi:mycothiol synthase
VGTAVEGYDIGHPGPGDAEPTLALMIRCDIAEYGEPDSDMEDLLHEWGQIDLQRDAWVAYDPDGELVGYAAVLPWGNDFRFEHRADPSWQDPDLGRALLARCVERAAALAAERDPGERVMGRLFIAHVDRWKQGIARAADFQPGQYYFQMQIDVTEPPYVADLPEGVVVRPFVPGADDRAVYELIQAAFDRPGRARPSYEQWREAVFRPEIHDPELWLLAEAGDELVGACLSFSYPSTGWVRQLGVAKAWRRNGIGAALLGRAFMAFHRRGFRRVGLTVESLRPDAHAFYQKLGMGLARQYDEYVKEIGAPIRAPDAGRDQRGE